MDKLTAQGLAQEVDSETMGRRFLFDATIVISYTQKNAPKYWCALSLMKQAPRPGLEPGT
jgi:hypothetical protein